MKRILAALLLCVLLTGCGSWMEGEYHSVTPHVVKDRAPVSEIPSVSGYKELYEAVANIVESGATQGRLSVEGYRPGSLESNLTLVAEDVKKNHPIGAYAVSDVSYEMGTSGGLSVVAVTVTYSRPIEELQAIKTAANMEKAEALLAETLTQCDSALVMRIEKYETADFTQLVEDFALENPDVVIEVPKVTATVYPDSGTERVVDLRLTYQTSRDSLRQMQRYVQPVFTSAALYVSSEEESDIVKYARLYTFLMERNDYKAETSLTPAYSLLRHGVGDHKAFSAVYAAMCRKAGLECYIVIGTHAGEVRFWNIICDEGVYYHVDLLSPNGFIKYSDAQMGAYVWDYSAYPACGVAGRTNND